MTTTHNINRIHAGFYTGTVLGDSGAFRAVIIGERGRWELGLPESGEFLGTFPTVDDAIACVTGNAHHFGQTVTIEAI